MNVLAVLLLVQLSSCVNISPVPNFTFKIQNYTTNLPKKRSSYFGYSLTLRRESIIIGAPRSQSMLKSQGKVDEPGVVFKCNLDEYQTCSDFNFDLTGNDHISRKPFHSQKKGFQMLGAAMDGGPSDSDKFLVCGPNYRVIVYNVTKKGKPIVGYKTEKRHYVHGVCYFVNDTKSSQPLDVHSMKPLQNESSNIQDYSKGNKIIYFYKYGGFGFSSHITENEEIIVGAPGVYNWAGTLVRYLPGKNLKPEVCDPRYYDKTKSDAYFGYSVSSGRFQGTNRSKLLYVSSAPRNEAGKVYVFDIDSTSASKKMHAEATLTGSQFGEYFGFSVLTEDFNNDGFPDLAVSSPFYSADKVNENGIVNIFMNLGIQDKVLFDEAKVLKSEFSGSGRFGTTLGKIGDVNRDGYNDIAISAPFEGNGAVYIFAGGKTGISNKPIQKLLAPSMQFNPGYDNRSAMFGHSISRGVDIDSNEYPDIAIGSPNSEHVFVYKTYPIVSIKGNLKSSFEKLPIDNSTVVVTACRTIVSRDKIPKKVDCTTTIIINERLARASFSRDKKIFKKSFNETLTNENHCFNITLYVQPKTTIYQEPLLIRMNHELKNRRENHGEKFCETCVLLDPAQSHETLLEIPYKSRCSGKNCTTNLSVVENNVNVAKAFVLGSAKTIELEYEIRNSGEPSYFTQLTIMSSESLRKFSKIPSSCSHDKRSRKLVCDIKNGQPISNKEKFKLVFQLDAEKIDGKSITITAVVTSVGEEQDSDDNKSKTEIIIAEFSEVEVIGQSLEPQYNMDGNLELKHFQFNYNIFNYGPSSIKELKVEIQIPSMYIEEPHNLTIINYDHANNLTTNSDIEQDLKSFETIEPNIFGSDDFVYDEDNSTDLSYNNSDYDESNDNSTKRRRRSLMATEDETLMKPSENKTVFFDCSQKFVKCLKTFFTVRDFKANGEPYKIKLILSINLTTVDKMLNNQQNIFLFQTNAVLTRVSNNNDSQSLNVTLNNPFTTIYAHLSQPTPIWVIIASSIGGFLTLLVIVYGLAKAGFFKRAKKEQLKKIIRDSKMISARELDALCLMDELED